MIQNGKRLVVFSDNPNDGLPYTYDYVVENAWGDASLEPECTKRFNSQPLTTPGLFVMNHFADEDFTSYWYFPGITSNLTGPSRTNDSSRIMIHANMCGNVAGRLPNFVAVDSVDTGNNGGPLQAVNLMNQVKEVNMQQAGM